MTVTTTYLEMLSHRHRDVPAPGEGVSVIHSRNPTIAYYRFLYDAVGRDWDCTSRKKLSDADLARIIHDPRDEVHVLFVEGAPAGFAELDRRTPGEIELVRFRLLPHFIPPRLLRHFSHS